MGSSFEAQCSANWLAKQGVWWMPTLVEQMYLQTLLLFLINDVRA
jgi:hypothetical protein